MPDFGTLTWMFAAGVGIILTLGLITSVVLLVHVIRMALGKNKKEEQ